MEKFQNYVEDDQMKNMSNRQLYDYSQKKLKEQDSQIDDLVGQTKKGNQLGGELKTELNKQNLLLDDVEKDVNNNLDNYLFYFSFYLD